MEGTYRVLSGFDECTTSPFDDKCLSSCLISFYYDSLMQACSSCLITCSYGCVRSIDCVLCTEKLCDMCSIIDSVCTQCKSGASLISPGKCECNSSYYEDPQTNECLQCPANCKKCSSNLDKDCTICNPGYKFFTNYQKCIPSDTCPGISPQSSDSCSIIETRMLYTEFSSFSDVFYDTSNKISFKTGVNSSSYPDYDITDPWVIPGRGMYFAGTQYLEMDNENYLKLGPELSISMWAKVLDSGSLFTRSDSSSLIDFKIYPGISFSVGITARDYLLIEKDYLTVSFVSNTWKLFQFFVARLSNTYRFPGQINSVYCYAWIDGFMDTAQHSVSLIGRFKGFIWSIEIYNCFYVVLENKNGGPSSMTTQLSECGVLEYSNPCTPCPSLCTNGCRRSETCSQCQDPLCKKCSNEFTCLECYENAQKNNNQCQCISSINPDTKSCNPILICLDNCSQCFSLDWNGCYKCSPGYILYSGVCIICPTGSKLQNEKCSFSPGIVFKSNFESLSGVFYDEISKIPLITGNSQNFYPDFDNEDPIPAYLRGFYFQESSVIRLPIYKTYKNPKLILSVNWTIDIWLNPSSSSGCFFSLSNTSELLSICHQNSSIQVHLTLLNSNLQINSFNLIKPLSSWNLLSVQFQYDSEAILKVLLNSETISSLSLFGGFLPNYYEKHVYEIGKSLSSYFDGFIYQISVFAGESNQGSRSLLTGGCLYGLNDVCIPDCDLDSYWVGPQFDDCRSCSARCETGCRREDSCSLCEDPLCYSCADFYNGTCSKCSLGSYDVTGCKCEGVKLIDFEVYQCVECADYQFYDNFTCVDCPILCSSCLNSSFCNGCVENSHLENDVCVCSLGFYYDFGCKEKRFDATFLFLDNRQVKIEFNEEVSTNLGKSYFEIKMIKSVLNSFELKEIDKKTFILKFKFRGHVVKDTKVKIKIVKSVYSVSKSKLNDYSKEFLLSEDQYEIDRKEYKKTGEIVAVTCSSSALSVNIVNPNPASLWSFINTIQMLCFIRLSTIDMPPKFFGYLKGLQKYNMFPNFFEYFITNSKGQQPYLRAYEFGYKNHLILKNIGNFISAFAFMIFLWFITYILSKLTRFKPFSFKFIKTQIENNLKKYKYSALIRFWITAYMDSCAASLIGIIMTSELHWISIVNFTVCLLFVIFTIMTPLMFYIFCTVNKSKIQNENEEVKIQFGALFQEFNNDKGLSSSQFYMIFFLRRIIYVCVLILLRNYPIVQISLNIFLSVLNFIYLVKFRPFDEKILNISNCVTEFFMISIFSLLLVSVLEVSNGIYDYIDKVLIVLVNSVLALQMASSLFIFFRTLILIIKSKCKKKDRNLKTYPFSSQVADIDDQSIKRF